MAGPPTNNSNVIQQLLQMLMNISQQAAPPYNTDPSKMGLANLTQQQQTWGAGMGATTMGTLGAGASNPWFADLLNGGPSGASPNPGATMGATNPALYSSVGLAPEQINPPWNPAMLKDMGGTIAGEARQAAGNAGSAIGSAAGNIGDALMNALKLPFQHPITAIGAGGVGAELLHLFGGGGNTQPQTAPTNTNQYSGTGTGPLGFANGANAAGGGVNYEANGGSPTTNQGNSTGNPALDALLAKLATGGLDTPSAQENAAANMIQAQAQSRLADAQIANYKVTQEIGLRDQAVKEGNLQLAQIHENNANIWSKRAADATDEANQLTARGQDVTMRGQDITAKTAADSNLTSLTNVVGTLLNSQADMQFKLNSTPMNAIASLLMGRGQSGSGQSSYAAPNMLGINPNMFSQLLQSTIGNAVGAAGSTATPTGVPDLNSILSGLAAKAQTAPQTIVPTTPADITGSIVGNRIPDYPR